MASGAAARLLHRRRVRPLFPGRTLCELPCCLPAGTAAAAVAVGRAAWRGEAYPSQSLKDASAPAPSSAAVAAARLLTAAYCSGVNVRATAAPAAALAHPDRARLR